MEFYAQALELNVWTSALVEKVGKDERGQWNVTVRRGGPNGTVRILHPTHVVIATGTFGKPRIPHFEGQVHPSGVQRPEPMIHTLFTNTGKVQGRDYSHIPVYKREEKCREESAYHRRCKFCPRRCRGSRRERSGGGRTLPSSLTRTARPDFTNTFLRRCTSANRRI